MIGAITYDGRTTALIVEGGANKAIFKEFMEIDVYSLVRPGDIIIMDNCSIHKDSFDKEKFEKIGVTIKYLPRYSPDLNPIEMMWSKMKTLVRKMLCRDFLSLWRGISVALLSVTAQDALGWFSACGYYH